MPKKLTAIAISNLKRRAKRYEVSDITIGLRVVVFPSGKKSYVFAGTGSRARRKS